jgi:hypothetical protein
MYDLKVGQNDHFSQKNQPKKPCVFHAPYFSSKQISFGQCRHFGQIESFEKLWFLIVQWYKKMFGYNKIYPLYSLVKHLKVCS